MSALDAVLVTGGAGFVGSHFARAAADAGSRVVVLDDLSAAPSWPALPAGIERVRGDVSDRALVARLIEEHRVTAVAHFASRTCVDESVLDPAGYFDQNVCRALALLDVVRDVGPRVFVLSSSAAVYGEPARVPISERERYAPVNPYGATKLAIEYALASYGRAYGIAWAALRYFNAAGAHPDGTLRERHDPETHLVPLAIDAALGRRAPLVIHGADYPTRDGTGARDYVHVCDLAEAHLAAIGLLDSVAWIGAINLGSGRASTVREVISAVAKAIGKEVPHEIGPRREGDPGNLVADVKLAHEVLHWRPRRDLETIVEDAARSRRDGTIKDIRIGAP